MAIDYLFDNRNTHCLLLVINRAGTLIRLIQTVFGSSLKPSSLFSHIIQARRLYAKIKV